MILLDVWQNSSYWENRHSKKKSSLRHIILVENKFTKKTLELFSES